MVALIPLLLLLVGQETDAERERRLKKEAQAAIKVFAKKMKDVGGQVDAVNELAKVGHELVAKKLIQVVTGPYPVDTRVAAAEAVGTCGVRKSAILLGKALSRFQAVFRSVDPKKQDEQRVCEAMVKALGELDNCIVNPMLVPILTKNNVPLMEQVLIAMGKMQDCSPMDELLRLYYAATSPEGQGRTNPRKALAKPAREAIQSILGEDFADAQKAKDWWKANKGGFKNKARKPEK